MEEIITLAKSLVGLSLDEACDILDGRGYASRDGLYTYCFFCGDYCIKLTYSQDFINIKKFCGSDFFKLLFPRIYWISDDGMVMVCQRLSKISFFNYDTADWRAARALAKELGDLMGVGTYDLHPANLVDSEQGLQIVDYGCLCENGCGSVFTGERC